MKPEFPLRLIFDDGECVVVDSPEDLLRQIDSVDSTDGTVWVRDALDRTVTLSMRMGSLDRMEVRSEV